MTISLEEFTWDVHCEVVKYYLNDGIFILLELLKILVIRLWLKFSDETHNLSLVSWITKGVYYLRIIHTFRLLNLKHPPVLPQWVPRWTGNKYSSCRYKIHQDPIPRDRDTRVVLRSDWTSLVEALTHIKWKALAETGTRGTTLTVVPLVNHSWYYHKRHYNIPVSPVSAKFGSI